MSGLMDESGWFVHRLWKVVPPTVKTSHSDPLPKLKLTRRSDHIRAQALSDAADAIQALHPGEIKNSVIFLRARADQVVK